MTRVTIPFVGPAYRAKSINASCQRAVNCYLEAGQGGAPVAMYGTPGLVLKATLGDGPIRDCIFANGYAWFVSGSKVYRVDSSFTVVECGSIGTSTGNIGIAANAMQILIVDGLGGYLVDFATSTVTAITDPDFPAGVTQATYQDGYFIVTGDGSGQFFINETPNNGALWNGTDFASAEGSPDNTVALISDHRELWLIGTDSAEIWVNTGNVDFPFERSGNVFIEHGIAAPFTLSKIDNTVFWLSSDSRGSGLVYRANGYQPERISTHAIESTISKYSTIADATGFTYQQDGHSFYVLNFPTGNATWVYDIATGEWHERAYMNQKTGDLSRWRAGCHVFGFNTHLVGDYETGKIYALDPDCYTDAGDKIKRIRSTLPANDRQLMMFFSMLQLNIETGVGDDETTDPQIMLRWSNDYGHTWSQLITTSIGKVGEYGARAIFWRLGSGRNRVWEISMTDPVKFALFSGIVEADLGNA